MAASSSGRMLDSRSGDTGSIPVAVIDVRVVEWQTHPAKNRHTEGSTPSTDIMADSSNRSGQEAFNL